MNELPPTIPIRGSSKLALEQESNPGSDELITKKKKLMEEIDRFQKTIKPKSSFTNVFWERSAQFAKMKVEELELKKRISLESFKAQGLDEKSWLETDEAKNMVERQNAFDIEAKNCARQAEYLGDPAKCEHRSKRKAFMDLFTTSTKGLKILDTGEGKRSGQIQQQFRQELIQLYDARREEPNEDQLWCPILKDYIDESAMEASHIFGHKHGADVMDTIFGVGSQQEMFTFHNGLLLCTTIERLFEDGLFVIVPNISDHPAAAELEKWNGSKAREYKIRIINYKHKAINKDVWSGQKGLTWAMMDHRPLEFKSSYRPRARYLYFHYCLQILRLSWLQYPRASAIKADLGKPFWGTVGRYMPSNMLLAFVEEIGHTYGDLMNGAVEGPSYSGVRDDTALQAAVSQVKKLTSHVGESKEKEEESEDDREDQSDDEFDFAEDVRSSNSL